LKIPTHNTAKKTENKIGPENLINNSRLLVLSFELIINSPKLEIIQNLYLQVKYYTNFK
jgi:hypothetical protein